MGGAGCICELSFNNEGTTLVVVLLSADVTVLLGLLDVTLGEALGDLGGDAEGGGLSLENESCCS